MYLRRLCISFLVLQYANAVGGDRERRIFFEHFWIENLKQAISMIEKGRHTKHTAEDTFYSSSDKRTYQHNGTHNWYRYTYTYKYVSKQPLEISSSSLTVLRRKCLNVLHILYIINNINLHFYHFLTVKKSDCTLYAILIDTINWWMKYFHSNPVSPGFRIYSSEFYSGISVKNSSLCWFYRFSTVSVAIYEYRKLEV